jgi:hypothetical protein
MALVTASDWQLALNKLLKYYEISYRDLEYDDVVNRAGFTVADRNTIAAGYLAYLQGLPAQIGGTRQTTAHP